MDDAKKVTCPECRGEGMLQYCAWRACRTCRGEGEITQEKFEQYQKAKDVTIAGLMHPPSAPGGQKPQG